MRLILIKSVHDPAFHIHRDLELPPMKKALFPTPQDAEAAFYDAFAKCDLDGMMAVWADDDEIFCVHPQGARIHGVAQVRESWREIFASGQTLSFHLREQHYVNGMMLSVHSVYEQINVAGEARSRSSMIATNIYLRTERGWRMVAHHASPCPSAPATSAEAGPRSVAKTLH
jgi:ketosteroid isomerase-like protein